MIKDLFIGVDIGGTHMRTALIDAHGKILRRQRSLTESFTEPAMTSRRLASECRRLAAESAQWGGRVTAIGLGVAGKIDQRRGLVVFSPNLPNMRDYPLAVELAQATQLPVYMENDANLFGLGEQWLGAGKAVRNWVGVTLGTGVGGCLILDGRLWTGDGLGFSGEIGHTIVRHDGPLCLCGLKGCLETYASGRALTEGVRRSCFAGELQSGDLWELSRSGELTPKDVYLSALRKEEPAVRLFEQMGWALGLALGNLFTCLGIGQAIIGGGVSASWDLFITSLKKSLVEHSSMLQERDINVRRSSLGDDAALLGAARLVQVSEAEGH